MLLLLLAKLEMFQVPELFELLEFRKRPSVVSELEWSKIKKK